MKQRKTPPALTHERSGVAGALVLRSSMCLSLSALTRLLVSEKNLRSPLTSPLFISIINPRTNHCQTIVSDEVSVSGLTVTTTVTSDDDDDSDDKSGLTHAELNAAIAVPILLCFGTAVAIAFRRSTVSRKAICGCCSRREDAAPAMAASMPIKAEETFNPVAGGSTSDPNVDDSSNDFV